MAISRELLEILACPQCKGALQLETNPSALRCDSCKLRYAIQDDIPNMLIDEAENLAEAVIDAFGA